MEPELRTRVTACLEESPGILAAWVFGSVARGDADEHSDLDIAILPRPDADPMDWLGLAADLESVAGTRVDVALLSLRNLVLAHEVLRDGILLVDRDPESRIDFESDAIVRYIDLLPTLRIARDGWREGWRRAVRELR